MIWLAAADDWARNVERWTATTKGKYGDGNYYTDDVTLSQLKANAQVVLRYCDADGKVTPDSNCNGSRDNIAGIINAGDGMHEHPTQALLDAYTIRERKGRLADLGWWLIGRGNGGGLVSSTGELPRLEKWR